MTTTAGCSAPVRTTTWTPPTSSPPLTMPPPPTRRAACSMKAGWRTVAAMTCSAGAAAAAAVAAPAARQRRCSAATTMRRTPAAASACLVRIAPQHRTNKDRCPRSLISVSGCPTGGAEEAPAPAPAPAPTPTPVPAPAASVPQPVPLLSSAPSAYARSLWRQGGLFGDDEEEEDEGPVGAGSSANASQARSALFGDGSDDGALHTHHNESCCWRCCLADVGLGCVWQRVTCSAAVVRRKARGCLGTAMMKPQSDALCNIRIRCPLLFSTRLGRS